MRSLRVGVVRVTGRSMEPTLHEGDRLVVLYGAPPVRGRLAVVRLPDGPDGPRPVSVKRVTGRAPGEPGSWWVERDNHAEGVDSWTVGGIPRPDVLGLVLARVPDRLVRLTAPRVTPRVRGGRRG